MTTLASQTFVEIAANVPRTSEPDHYEIIDGTMVEKHVSAREMIWATLLLYYLRDQTEPRSLGTWWPEMLFHLRADPCLERKPDVAFVSSERWPASRALPETAAWEVVPNLAIEVLSKTNSVIDVKDKVADYFEAGVEQVWLVYPSRKLFEVYDSLTSIRVYTPSDVWTPGPVLPGVEISMPEFFKRLGVKE